MAEIPGWIFIGLVAGVLGKLIMPGRDPGGFIVTILLGIAGALLAGFVGREAGFYRPGENAGWIAATLGAIVILILYRIIMKSRQSL
ncbi:GlsB/YeaQ/YmgE family stress response membrane protein [Flavisphingomonas formosensis]|uniref:GlsB/YeaQ/YmgE family stress response membrane protein n=1 Tax=Flavisphingomonas formosensis TaxID=861534 RepID=UPI0018DF344A|nr:GlsB/YeaQ/YmgE family stress response membrane protein [Sphingomonas formosensis]